MRLSITIFLVCFAALALAQDSPMNAAPGQPPPPEGWTQEAPPNGGIHLPSKKKKLRTRIRTSATPVPTPQTQKN